MDSNLRRTAIKKGIVTTLRELAVEGGLARRIPEDVPAEIGHDLGDPLFGPLAEEQKILNDRAVDAVDRLPEAA